MNILFFTKGNRSVASSRARVWAIAEHLKENFNIDYTILADFQYPWWLFSRARFIKLRAAYRALHKDQYDIIFIHKSLFAWDILLIIFLCGKKIIYDLDDAEWLHSQMKSALLAKMADVVFCGSNEILYWAQKYNRNSLLLPTSIDADLYMKYPIVKKDNYLTIGWVGNGRAHFRSGNFDILVGVLNRLAESITFRFVIIGTQYYQPLKDLFIGKNYEVIFVDEADWQNQSTSPVLMQKYAFDIGVMPLANTAFNRAKCALKAVEYMAMGIPVVASEVGEACVLIQDGVNGFLAHDENEWFEKLQKLLLYPECRLAIGMKGQETVQLKYSFRAIIPKILSVLQSL